MSLKKGTKVELLVQVSKKKGEKPVAMPYDGEHAQALLTSPLNNGIFTLPDKSPYALEDGKLVPSGSPKPARTSE